MDPGELVDSEKGDGNSAARYLEILQIDAKCNTDDRNHYQRHKQHLLNELENKPQDKKSGGTEPIQQQLISIHESGSRAELFNAPFSFFDEDLRVHLRRTDGTCVVASGFIVIRLAYILTMRAANNNG
jgi:hypothetical protein